MSAPAVKSLAHKACPSQVLISAVDRRGSDASIPRAHRAVPTGRRTVPVVLLAEGLRQAGFAAAHTTLDVPLDASFFLDEVVLGPERRSGPLPRLRTRPAPLRGGGERGRPSRLPVRHDGPRPRRHDRRHRACAHALAPPGAVRRGAPRAPDDDDPAHGGGGRGVGSRRPVPLRPPRGPRPRHAVHRRGRGAGRRRPERDSPRRGLPRRAWTFPRFAELDAPIVVEPDGAGLVFRQRDERVAAFRPADG